MIFETNFLSGKEFDNYKVFYPSISDENLLCSRPDLLKRLVKGKKIIHIGCVDHLEIIEEKVRKNQWVHKIVTESAHRCIGIDINQEGLDFVKNKLGFDNVFYHDILLDNPLPQIEAEQWDYLLLGEILEHVDNPVLFLESLRRKYANRVKGVIVSVPNAFCLNNIRASFRKQEVINTDHRYWFTPYTLSKVFYRAGISPDVLHTCLFEPTSSRGVISKMLLTRLGLLRDTLVLTGHFF